MVLNSFREKYVERKVFVIFEPASATARSDIFQAEFFDSLKKSHAVAIIKSSKKTTALGRQTIDYHGMEKKLVGNKVLCSVVENLSSLKGFLESHVDSSWVVISFSNGKVLGLRNSEIIQKS